MLIHAHLPHPHMPHLSELVHAVRHREEIPPTAQTNPETIADWGQFHDGVFDSRGQR